MAAVLILFSSHFAFAAQAKKSSEKKPPEAAACEKKGGKLIKAGMMGVLHCIVPYSDAGKKCTDAKQCKGGCVYALKGGDKDPKVGTKVSGRCKADNNFGCFGWVKNGVVDSATCAD